jgi:flagellar motor switch protein FliN/FliY
MKISAPTPPEYLLKKIKELLQKNEKIPAVRPLSLSEELLASSIKKSLGIENLSIELQEGESCAKKELFSGLGDDSQLLSFLVSPLKSEIFLAMSQKDIAKLTSWTLTKTKTDETLFSDVLEEGFYLYLTLETLKVLQTLPAFSSFSLKLSDSMLPEEKSFFIKNIKITIDKKSLWTRLILPYSFVKEWNDFFETSPFSLEEVPSSFCVDLTPHLGYTLLKKEDFAKLQPGDWMLLEHAGFSLESQKALITLNLGKTPIFQAKVKQNRITLLDFAFYYEKETEKEDNKKTLVEQKSEEDNSEKDNIGTDEIKIAVEMNPIDMTLEKLFQLQPGNFLEIATSPEQNINLVIDGKVLGKGEIVYLGEALGVRILELEK